LISSPIVFKISVYLNSIIILMNVNPAIF